MFWWERHQLSQALMDVMQLRGWGVAQWQGVLSPASNPREEWGGPGLGPRVNGSHHQKKKKPTSVPS